MIDRLAAGRPAEAVLFAGSRGMGKTVLLRECERRAKDSGWFTSFEEVDRSLPLRQVMALNARDVLLDMSATKRFGERLKKALGVLKAFTSIGVLGVNISFDAEMLPGTADTGIFRRDLLALFEELGEVAASDGSGVVFFLDELHTLSGHDEMETLDAVLHGIMQKGYPVSVVGAGVYGGPGYEDPDDPPHRQSKSTYSGRLYHVIRLQPLVDAAASDALKTPAEKEGFEFAPDALRLAVDFAGGFPWFLQLVGDAAWESAARSPIGSADVSRAIDASRQRLKAEFFPRLLDNLDASARRVLGGFAGRREDLSQLELSTSTGVSVTDVYYALRVLIDRDIAARTEDGSYALAIPQLCEYLAEPHRL